MKTPDPRHSIPSERDDEEFGTEEYDQFEMLERLETLREDMEDLGITTLQELIERIKELHRQLDQE
jgi:hypothetical protein